MFDVWNGNYIMGDLLLLESTLVLYEDSFNLISVALVKLQLNRFKLSR
jgi:hypothetical protein